MEKPTLLLVSSKMCSACLKAKEVLPEIAEKLGLALVVIDIEDAPSIAKAMIDGRIPQVVPQLYLLDPVERKAKLVAIGFPTKTQEIEDKLRRILSKEENH